MCLTIEQFSRCWYGKCLLFVLICANFTAAAINLILVFLVYIGTNVFCLESRIDSWLYPNVADGSGLRILIYVGFFVGALSHLFTAFAIFNVEPPLMLLSVIVTVVAIILNAITSLFVTLNLIISLAFSVLILAWFASSLSVESDPNYKNSDSLSISTCE